MDDAEIKSRIDLGALVTTICDDLIGGGALIDCDCAPGVIMSCKRVGIKRAVTILIEKAIKYGQRARVGMQVSPHAVIVSVEERGSGIPASQLEGAPVTCCHSLDRHDVNPACRHCLAWWRRHQGCPQANP